MQQNLSTKIPEISEEMQISRSSFIRIITIICLISYPFTDNINHFVLQQHSHKHFPIINSNFIEKFPRESRPCDQLDFWNQECGTEWQNNYSTFHRHMLENPSSPNAYFVAVALESGLADRITGIITQFLFSLITNRALVHVSYGYLPDWDVAFDTPHIHLKPPAHLYLGDELLDPLKYTYKGVWGYTGKRDFTHLPVQLQEKYAPFYILHEEHIATEIFGKYNLSTYIPLNKHIISSSNRGRSYLLFDNPYHNEFLYSLGLKPETALGCVAKYLFRLNAATCTDRVQQMEKMLIEDGKNNFLRIGIQVRVGDAVFEKGLTVPLEYAQAHFECAEEIARTRATPGQSIRYFFISDSLELRKAAKEFYKEKLITNLEDEPMHVNCYLHNPAKCDKTHVGFRNAVADMYLFSLNDFHVVSKTSGFGALGAWMSPISHRDPSIGRRHIYRIKGSTKRTCGISDTDSVAQISLDWAGF